MKKQLLLFFFIGFQLSLLAQNKNDITVSRDLFNIDAPEIELNYERGIHDRLAIVAGGVYNWSDRALFTAYDVQDSTYTIVKTKSEMMAYVGVKRYYFPKKGRDRLSNTFMLHFKRRLGVTKGYKNQVDNNIGIFAIAVETTYKWVILQNRLILEAGGRDILSVSSHSPRFSFNIYLIARVGYRF